MRPYLLGLRTLLTPSPHHNRFRAQRLAAGLKEEPHRNLVCRKRPELGTEEWLCFMPTLQPAIH